MRYPTWTPELRIPILMGGFVEKRGETRLKNLHPIYPKGTCRRCKFLPGIKNVYNYFVIIVFW